MQSCFPLGWRQAIITSGGSPRAIIGSASVRWDEECALIRYLMSKLVVAAVFAVFLYAVRVAPAQTIVYVDQHATGPVHDGTSWCSAHTNLQDALTAAVVDTEIRVADGIYKPSATAVRTSTFFLRDGVAILGGFAGCGAADPDLRDLSQFESILSGDLLGNDDPDPSSSCCAANLGAGCDDQVCQDAVATERLSCQVQWDLQCATWARILCAATCGNRSDNSYHVVTAAGADDTAVVDGFSIEGGQADDLTSGAFRERGAGILNYFDPSAPVFRNCIVRRNVAAGKGGGAYNHQTSAAYENCLFVGNVAKDGGAMTNFSRDGNPILINCTLAGNVAAINYGGIWNANLFSDDIVTLRNCILWDNEDGGGKDESAQMSTTPAQLILLYSTVQGWTGAFGGIGNNGDNPLFADLPGVDGLYGTSDDDLSLSPGSPAINRGDPATDIENGRTDVAGSPRLTGCRVDRGALESGEVQVDFDYDADGSVTLADYAAWQYCVGVSAADAALQSTCLCLFDADGSNTLDVADIAPFQAALNGP